MKATIIPIIALLLDQCGGSDPAPPPPTSPAPSCEHYYTCEKGSDFGCVPGDNNICKLNNQGDCVDRGCIGQPAIASAPPPGATGMRIIFRPTTSTPAAIGIQKYNHSNGVAIGHVQYVQIPPNRGADKVAAGFCAMANFMGVYCSASGNVANFYNDGFDVMYDVNNVTEDDVQPIPLK